MNDQIMVDTTDPLDNSCHQMKLPVLGIGYIPLSCWPKGSHGNSQTTQAVAKTVSCSPQTDGKAHC